MGLETNLNTSPYFDDFDIEKNFHRILFKPSVAVQARELTQLQTILQNQIERMGNNLFQEGTIITGGNFVEIDRFPYVKINDTNTDNDAVAMSSYVGKYAVGLVTGLRAKIETVKTGFESQTPDLNTLYVKYLTTNDGGDKTFNTSENIEIQEADGTVLDTVTVAGTSDDSPIGEGYGVRCGDGLIFQKGHFIRFSDSIAIVSKYDTTPDDYLVGFKTTETTVNSNQDTTLLDNAQGFNNYNAPGADRLKLTPTLVAYTSAEAAEDESFFAIQEYKNGNVIRRRLTTVYNVIQKLIEKRSVEENGNFVVNRFPLRIQESTSNSDILQIVVGPGLAYVEGNRIETVGEEYIDFGKADDTATISAQDVVANYGNYVQCANLSGYFNINTFETVNLENASANTIGTAYIRSLLQTDLDEYRAYLFNIKMNSGESFENVRTINGSSGAIDVTLNSSNNAVLSDHSFKRAVYPLGKDAVEGIDLSDTQYRYRSVNTTATMTTGGLITLNLPAGDTFPYTVSSTLNSTQKQDLIVVSTETSAPWSNGDVIDLANATVTVATSSQLTIQMNDAGDYPASTMDVAVYHTADKDVSTVNSKTLETIYVKIDTSTHSANTTGPWSLGVPDVYSIEAIYVGNTYSANNTDMVSSFSLFQNQKDTHYGLSYFAANGSSPLSSGDKLLVKAKAFRNTSGVETFFTVDSYPVDDVTTSLPSNKIRTEDIPVYKTDSGERISLRDAIDLRPHAANTAAYSATVGSATENPADTLAFGSTNKYFIAPNEAVTTNFDYYLSRIDRLVLDYTGTFYVITGESSENPIPPETPKKAISPALIKVRPYPSLPVATAARADRNEYSVFITRINNDNYYPDDIREIENRIKRLEDYTALTLLETKATDLVIQDENGLDRFKNGILVDSFKDLSIANIQSSQFSASIDPVNSELLPRFRSYPLDLKVANSSSMTTYGETALLTSSDEVVLNQAYATSQKSCTTDFWKFNGTMFLSPEADSTTDFTRAPDLNSDNDENPDEFQFNSRLSEFFPLLQIDPKVNQLQTTTAINQTRTSNIVGTSRDFQSVLNQITQRNGDFVTDLRFNSFMRSREIEITATGMRPNTRVYFYFDKVDVNAHVAPAELMSSEVKRNGAYGDTVKTTSEGKLYAVFRIPAETFYVGARKLEVFDVNQYNSRGAASTYARAEYNGFNINGNISESTPITRPPKTAPIDWEQLAIDASMREHGGDPLAQTFIVDREVSDDNVVFVSKLDLYFAEKSDTNGVTVELREVTNGYPSGITIPFSRKHIDASSINANNTSAATATTVTFDSPIALKTDTEYAVIIQPDANDPDYLVWIARTGESDVDSNFNVVHDTNAGVLFTSTNNKAWTPYQDENLKFKLYKSLFTASSGQLTLTNKNDEFFYIANVSGTFTENEYVFVDSNTYLTGNVTVNAGNTTIVGTGTLFTSEYEEGEHIVVDYPSNTQVLEISSIANNTYMTVSDIPKEDATDVVHYNSVVGKVSYFYNRDPKTLCLTNSSAKTGSVFANGSIIVGEDSGAEATITSILDVPISYIQPNIMRNNFALTRTKLTGSLRGPSAQYNRSLKFNDNNYLIINETVLKSRSNEITDDSGTKSFALTINATSTSSHTSPLIDYGMSSVIAYEYFINNDSTNEIRNYGNAESKYVTNKVELADGLDAEDIRVYLTAYKPPETDVEVWVKFMAATDPNEFDDCTCSAWTKLERKAENNVSSSSANRNDFREYEYALGEVVLGDNQGAYLENGSTFKYTDADGAVYTSYKIFAVKIVLLSSSHKIVPRVKDMRAIAIA